MTWNYKKKNKYNAKKTMTMDGNLHDSKHEAERWAHLCLLQKKGIISDLRRQVPFELIPKQDGERAVKYIADFVYRVNGKELVEDAKSPATRKNADYIIKRKLMLFIHGIHVIEV